MITRVGRWSLGVLLVILGSSPPILAQGLTGQMAGTVVDESGSVLPGATITVLNTGTQVSR